MNIMVRVKSKQYGLDGNYDVEKLNETFYKFTQGSDRTIYVPESDIKSVDGFTFKNGNGTVVKVRSYKYNFSGDFMVFKLNGTIYRFKDTKSTVCVPKSDIANVEGFTDTDTDTDPFGKLFGIYHKYVKEDGTETFIPQYITPESHNNSAGISGGKYKKRRATKRARRTRRRYSRRK
jgi:hypothetical protein